MPASKPHILVTGPHRSGTTWIGNTIAEHGGMRLLLEPFNRHYQPYGFGHSFENAYTDVESASDANAIAAAFDAALAESPGAYAAGVCQATSAGLRYPLRYLWHCMDALRRPRVLIKDPLALFSAGWLAERYGLQVICTMRSPWSFVASLKVAKWGFHFANILQQEKLAARLPTDLVGAMEDLQGTKVRRIEAWSVLWNLLHHQISAYQDQHPGWHFVRYEDIAAEPIVGFEKMLDYLGLAMTPHVRSYIEDYTSSKNPQETNSVSYQPRDAAATIESWRERLTREEIDQVTELTAPLAGRFYADIDPS